MYKNKHSRSRLALSSEAKRQSGVSGHRGVGGKAGCFKAGPEVVASPPLEFHWPLWLHWLKQMHEARTVYLGEEQILVDIAASCELIFPFVL